MSEETIEPQWICMACKTVIGPIVDDFDNKCKCTDEYLIELWRVAPIPEGRLTPVAADGATVRRSPLLVSHQCCAKAVQLPCVCLVAMKCPDHGEQHLGSHE